MSELIIDFVKRIALEYGIKVNDEKAEALLWEFTGFPTFWETNDPPAEMEAQLRKAFEEGKVK